MPNPSTTSSWNLWIDALVSNMRATSGYRSPVTVSTVDAIAVYDGTEVGMSAEVPNRYLVIGWSGDPDQPSSPGGSTQLEATAGTARSRDETGTVICYAVAQTGDASIAAGSTKVARDQAFAIVAGVETFIRQSPNMALGTTGQVRLAQISGLDVEQGQTQGAFCCITFVVSYLARI